PASRLGNLIAIFEQKAVTRQQTADSRRQASGNRKPNNTIMQMELTIEAKTETKTFRDATREQNRILARLERAALYGMAARMASRVNSGALSILVLVGMICAA